MRHIKGRIQARLPTCALFDDVVHAGVLGLIDAVDKFDPSKNVSTAQIESIHLDYLVMGMLKD